MSMRISGLASGIDMDGIIEQLMAIERRPLVMMQQKQQELEAQKGAWRDVNTRLRNLTDKFSALKLQATYLAKAAESSDKDVLTATAGHNAGMGTYKIEVEQLATGFVKHGEEVAEGASKPLAVTGTITISTEAGEWEIEVGINDTLNDIVRKLNSVKNEDDKSAPVSASVVASRLVLASKETGQQSDFTVQVTGDLADKLGAWQEVQQGQDAKVKINGIEVESASNSLKDVIQGVTIDLKDTGTSTLTVTQDTKAVVDAVQAFVDQYNSTIDFINEKLQAKSQNDPNSVRGALSGDTTLMRLQNSLRNMVVSRSSYTEGKYVTLADIGVATAKFVPGAADYSGKLNLDVAKLEEALKADPLAVKDILFKQTNVAALGTASLGPDSASFDDNLCPLDSVLNGVTDATNWGKGEGWASAGLPQSLIVNFNGTRTLDSVRLYTLDTDEFPAEIWGVSDYKIYYLDDKGNEHLLAEVEGNKRGVVTSSANGARAQALRFEFTGSNHPSNIARVVEIEAFESSGVLYNLEQYIRDFTRAGDGILTEKDKSYERQINDLKEQAERLEYRLELRQERLVSQFVALERALATMQSQGNWLTSQVSQLNNMFSQPKK